MGSQCRRTRVCSFLILLLILSAEHVAIANRIQRAEDVSFDRSGIQFGKNEQREDLVQIRRSLAESQDNRSSAEEVAARKSDATYSYAGAAALVEIERFGEGYLPYSMLEPISGADPKLLASFSYTTEYIIAAARSAAQSAGGSAYAAFEDYAYKAMEQAFWSAPGTLQRRAGDYLAAWYMKAYAAPLEKAQYVVGVACRWLVEHPWIATSAAAVAAVTGSLLYYWYKKPKAPAAPTDKALQAEFDVEPEEEVQSALEGLENSSVVADKSYAMKLIQTGEMNFFSLLAAQSALLRAALEGKCEVAAQGKGIPTQIPPLPLETDELARLLSLRSTQAIEEFALLPQISAKCGNVTINRLTWHLARPLIEELEALHVVPGLTAQAAN